MVAYFLPRCRPVCTFIALFVYGRTPRALISCIPSCSSLITMSFTMRLKSMIWGDQSEGPSFDQTSHFFLPNATGSSRSYWLQGVSASPLLDHRTTAEIPSRAEVVIIGSGVRYWDNEIDSQAELSDFQMSGSLTAYELLHSSNPPKSVVVLEAREMCSGKLLDLMSTMRQM